MTDGSQVHTIQLSPLQAKAVQDGATLLVLPWVGEQPAPGSGLYTDTGEVYEQVAPIRDDDIVWRPPYAPGDVLRMDSECKCRVTGPVCYNCKWRPHTCVTVTRIEAKRPRELETMGEYGGQEHWMICQFDAIHGAGAYDRNDWYWFVTIERDHFVDANKMGDEREGE